MSELRDPVALVTGGAIRVGEAIVHALLDAGWRVWVHYGRSHQAARDLVDTVERRAPGRALGPVRADLADETQRRGLVEIVLDPAGPATGRIDMLVNNAASFERGELLERADADLRRVMETNFVAPVSLARALAPALAASSRAGGGTIVNLVDLGAVHPWPRYFDHCCAKAALAFATRALALELAPTIRVNAIAPGTVRWPDDAAHAEGSADRAAIVANIPLGHIGTPGDVARTVLFMADSPHLSGQLLAVDGGRLARFGR